MGKPNIRQTTGLSKTRPLKERKLNRQLYPLKPVLSKYSNITFEIEMYLHYLLSNPAWIYGSIETVMRRKFQLFTPIFSFPETIKIAKFYDSKFRIRL